MKKKIIKVGLIGYRGHAKRIIRILEKSRNVLIGAVYHPYKRLDLPKATTDIDDLLDCDAIFILSPNSTHYSYLQYLGKKFKGYIFCEKPPVVNKKQLRSLSLKKTKTFFNFNYRFSYLKLSIEKALVNNLLGEPLYCDVVVTHGLAYSKNYASSWRADGDKHKHGIVETVAIHYVDLLSFLFGGIKEFKYYPEIISKKGTAYDTCYLILVLNNGMKVGIFVSYASPLKERFSIIGSNGILELCGNRIRVYGPRDVFNSKGFFTSPPCLKEFNPGGKDLYEDSLHNSVNYFLIHCVNKAAFPTALYALSLKSNEFILNLK